MPAPAIHVENLSKLYRLGERQESYRTLRESLSAAALSPFRRLSRVFGSSAHSQTEIRNRRSENFWALKDVSFDVQPGEVVGIIGRNGAGKSTLLKVISRITEPSGGSVQLRGRVASLLEVGTGFHPELTGRENIYMNGAILGMGKWEIDKKFDEIVEFSGMKKFLDTPLKRYSSGMQVRLAFAVAAHLEPEILIIDEVLAVGDAEFQRKCLGKMQDVAQGGRTVLFVSHNMAAVSSLCSRGIVLSEGKVCKDDGIETAVESYLALSMRKYEDSERSLDSYRERWCIPMIKSVTLNGKPAHSPMSIALGGPLVVRMTFDSTEHPLVRKPVMGVVFHHATKGTVAGVNTRMTGLAVPSDEYRAGSIDCFFPKIPFLQGRYYADVWFGDGPTDLDVLKQFLVIDIEESDYYGTGHAPFANMGTVFLDAEWTLHS